MAKARQTWFLQYGRVGGDQPAQEPHERSPEKQRRTERGSWTGAILILVGAVVLGAAFILPNIWLGVAGIVVGLVGMTLAVASGIMSNFKT